MASKKKISVSWSGGKDSAFALFKWLQQNDCEIVHLHTVIDEQTRRVGLHGIRETLIEKQAQAMRLPLKKLYLKSSDNHEAYRQLMLEFYRQCAGEGIEAVLFGDIFLEDLKAFRESLLKPNGIEGIYPLWLMDTTVLVHEFMDAGFKTVICSANARYFSSSDVGKTIDKQFIESLSPEVDPCGENGEFHTFVYNAPLYRHAVTFHQGDVVERSYRYNVRNDDGTFTEKTTTFWFRDFYEEPKTK